MLKNTKRNLIVLGLLLLTISVVALSVIRFSGFAQQNPRTITVLRKADNTNQQSKIDKEKVGHTMQTPPSSKEIDDASAPIVDLTATDSDARSFDENRLQKDRSHNNASFESIEANPSSDDVNIVSESSIPDLPVEMSNLIVEGIVTNSNAFLSED